MNRKPNFIAIFAIALIAIGANFLTSCNADDEEYDFNGVYTMANGVKTRSGEWSYVTHVYTFPSSSELLNSSAVLSQAAAAWELMINAASPYGRQEFGFYIYFNHSTQEIYCGDIISGNFTSGGEYSYASINLGDDINHNEVCGIYHCHTTLQYVSSTLSRDTGPSEEDKRECNRIGLPGLVEDYVKNPIVGHESALLPHSIKPCGPDRRNQIIIIENVEL